MTTFEFCGINFLVPGTCADNHFLLEFSTNMHKANTPSAKKLGGGLFVVDPREKSKYISNNTGKAYFKWAMAERNMLLIKGVRLY